MQRLALFGGLVTVARYKGTYALTKNGDAFVMHLVGKVSAHPLDDRTLHP